MMVKSAPQPTSKNIRHTPSPLYQIFYQASRGKNYVSLQDLQAFLCFVQKDDLETLTELHLGSFQKRVTESTCKAVLAKYQDDSRCGREEDETMVMDYHEFTRMLLDAANNQVAFQKTNAVWQDMSLPLSRYFICSSHNTYLAGNQFSSSATPQAIKKALLLGVRNVELDCYDGENGFPVVTHKPFAVSPCSFEECIRTVSIYGHQCSAFPVILTLENHCSLEQQRVQAELIQKYFGSKLYRPEKVDGKTDADSLHVGPTCWASPEKLKFKFLLRDKPIRDLKKRDKVRLAKEKLQYRLEHDFQGNRLLFQESTNKEEQSKKKKNSNSVKDPKAPSRLKGCNEQLLSLVYMKNVKLKKKKVGPFVSFLEPERLSSSSISETKMIRYAKNLASTKLLQSYTKRHILRVYPKSTRLWSSNYDPIGARHLGCQMAALNYQTFTEPVWLDQGFFAINGRCGFVLKPKSLLEKEDTFYQKQERRNLIQKLGIVPQASIERKPCLQSQEISLRIRVISCHNFPDAVDAGTFVKVALHSSSKGSGKKISNDVSFVWVNDKNVGRFGVNESLGQQKGHRRWRSSGNLNPDNDTTIKLESDRFLEIENGHSHINFNIVGLSKELCMISFVLKRSSSSNSKYQREERRSNGDKTDVS